MSQDTPHPDHNRLPANVKVLGWASFLNDVASEGVFLLLPRSRLAMLGGNRLEETNPRP